jgi:hypothetical protein
MSFYQFYGDFLAPAGMKTEFDLSKLALSQGLEQ